MAWPLRARLDEDERAARGAAAFGDAFVPSNAPDSLYGTDKSGPYLQVVTACRSTAPASRDSSSTFKPQDR